MKDQRYWAVLSCLAISLVGGSAFADFGVIDDNPGSTDYGRAQTGSFHRAIVGGSPMTADEKKAVAAMLPERTDQRFYGRFRVNFSSLILEQLKNSSGGTDATGAVNKKRTTANQSGLELAVGYSWSPSLRGDIEYLVNKNMTYAANPVLTGSGVTQRQINAIIKNNTVLANAYYDFGDAERFKPYITGGLGLAVNSVEATLSPAPASGGSNTTRVMRPAWALGAGLRVGIFSRWYMDMSYRYIRLGNQLSIHPNQTFKLKGNYSANVMSVGVLYLF